MSFRSGRFFQGIAVVALSALSVNGAVSTGHFSYAISPSNMTVECVTAKFGCIPKINGVALVAGDEIAAVDSTGQCIGSARWNGSSIGIPVMGYDNTGGIITPGLKAGQKVQFRVWDSSAKVEVSIVHYHFCAHAIPIPNTDSTYVANGISALDTLSGTTSSPPVAPVLSLPTNGATGQSVSPTLAWGSVSGATSYGLQLSTVSTFASTVSSQTGLTATSRLISGLANNVKYFWQANAANASGTGSWSSLWSFTTIAGTAPGVPALSSPTNGATGQSITPTLAWGSVSGATSYGLQLSTVSTFASTVSNQTGLTATSRPISGLANSVKYFWRANAANANGNGSWSSVWNFTTIAGTAPGAPALSSPTNGATGQSVSPTLAWGSVSSATSYGLQLSTVSTFASTVSSQTGLTATSRSISGLANSVKYFWRANAANANGTGSWSSVWNFTTIAGTAPGAPALSSPTNGATGQSVSPTLAWGSVSSATSYGLQLSTVSTFASTVSSQTGLAAISRTITGLANSVKYFWRANAANAYGTGSWSSAWNFTTVIAAPAAPALTSPANNATNQASALTLSWGSSANAASYGVQVSTVSTFASTVSSVTGLTARTRAISGLSRSVKYYWRVNATNAGGNSAWSAAWNFTVSATASPSMGAPTSILLESGLSMATSSVAIRKSQIIFSIAHPGQASISVIDLRGRSLVDFSRFAFPGNYAIGLRDRGLAPGRYLLHFKCAGYEKNVAFILTP